MGKSQQSGRGFVNGTYQFRSVLRCFFEQIIRNAFEVARRFLARIADLTGFGSGFLAIPQDGSWHVAALYPPLRPTDPVRLLPVAESGVKDAPERPVRGLAPGETPPPKAGLDQLIDRDVEHCLGAALADFLPQHGEKVWPGKAEQILGREAAALRQGGPPGGGALIFSGRCAAMAEAGASRLRPPASARAPRRHHTRTRCAGVR